jgi:hypothetical protein
VLTLLLIKAEKQLHASEHEQYLAQRGAVVERRYRLWSRLILVVFTLLFLYGAWRFLGERDKERISMMLSCISILPAVLLFAYLRKRALLALSKK